MRSPRSGRPSAAANRKRSLTMSATICCGRLRSAGMTNMRRKCLRPANDCPTWRLHRRRASWSDVGDAPATAQPRRAFSRSCTDACPRMHQIPAVHGVLSATCRLQEVAMPKREPLAPMTVSEKNGAVRSPKTAEIVADTLRRMIVEGQLKDGDFLPYEAELMDHFQVSRPSLREAVRVLESDRLVEVRRGSRTGARVRVPGPEIVARPAGFLLEMAGTTLADVMTARMGIEPYAARLLAENGTATAHRELRDLIDEIPAAWGTGKLAAASTELHRRLVELSGNATLTVIAGMLHEIFEKHMTAAFLSVQNVVPKAQYTKLIRSYTRLADLVAERQGDEAEAHWRRHMENAGAALLKGYEKTKVRDIMH